jgi:hypothetical protein
VADLFRPEAVEHHTQRGGPGVVLRVAPRWTAWLFWVLLLAVTAGCVAVWFVRVDGERLISLFFAGG